MPRRVKIASLIGLGLHGVLVLAGNFNIGYDAYTHMFFADHYLHGWWNLWDPRWYTGFTVVSYPPLVHQSIALLAKFLGIGVSYGLLLWLVLGLYPLAIYRFSRLFTGERAAGSAAMGGALLPSLFLAAHTFGQLPTLAATLVALFCMPVLSDYLSKGNSLSGGLAIALSAVMMAAHHATLLFFPWLVGVVALRLVLQSKTRKMVLLARLGLFILGATAAILVVIWPFWNWGRTQVMQTPIDHASRHNLLRDPSAAGMFFLAEYGLLIPLIPLALWQGRRKRFWGLTLAFSGLFILGLGGTTPLPRWIFGSRWAWLTYDRFSFWASLLLLPFFGILMATGKSIQHRASKVYFGLLGLTALVIGFMPSWLPTQPRQLDMKPIVNFLAQAGRSNYRYLTFGFGDQFAYLSRLTKATTIDGSYHTARTLPELRSSGIGQIDTSFWLPGGMAALGPILKESGQRGVRWGFVDLKSYDPVLQRDGWLYLTTLTNGVEVWENPAAILPPVVTPPSETPFEQFSWGVFPLFSLALAGGLALRRYWAALSRHIFRAIQALAVGLLPVGLVLWYYRTVFTFPHPRIYFTYTDALVFISDGLVIIAILAWLGYAQFNQPSIRSFAGQLKSLLSTPTGWLLGLCLLATLSAAWSLDWRISLSLSLQFWLLLAFYLSLRNTPQAWRWFLLGCGAALAMEVFFGIWQFAAQSTAMTLPLHLSWPGDLLPGTSGASVVELADGIRWLRAYGTLPHPNLLGGFVMVFLVEPLMGIFSLGKPGHFTDPADTRIHAYGLSKKWIYMAVATFCLGISLLVFTFSRSAWLGYLVLLCVLILKRRAFDRRRLSLVLGSTVVIVGLLLAFFSPLFFTRLGDSQVQTEQVSSFTRMWLVDRTIELIRKNPLLGTGVGSYTLALSNHVAAFYKIEPIHNLPLLVIAELGVGGLILMIGLMLVVLRGVLRARTIPAILLSGSLLGLVTISFFDHYLWTLAPGRTLFFAVLGLWAGQVKWNEDRN